MIATVDEVDVEIEAGPVERRWWIWAQHAFLAVVTYTCMLTTAPGYVAADTKAYLYLDPGRLLSRAWSLWDPNVALGTVTHQNIGYLWPMGPWFWAFDRLGVPMWVAQRLWTATLLYLAGAGVLYLVRTLGWGRIHPAAALAAASIYAFSPYVLDYAARISVLLLPWAGLPWLVGLTHRAIRDRSWLYPALIALVVATIGGTNATSILLVGLGPLLWVLFAVFVHREVKATDALVAVLKIGVLSLVVSLWWIAGLVVQGSYGLDVLRYTESIETVARSSLASEVLRGLGYWFFYGTDKLGPWIEPGRTFTQSPVLIAVGFGPAILAVGAVAMIRWRRRGEAVALIVVGTVVAVGAYPYAHPELLGRVIKAFGTSSTIGLALRSTARVVPLVCLGIALAIGAGLSALARRFPRRGWLVALPVIGLALLTNPPLWTGGFVGKNLRRPEQVPQYWKDATASLDAAGSATRVLEVPGSDFAAYRWGNTVDDITPGLMDRPVVARELVPFGTPPSADLVKAFDGRLQEGVLDPAAVVPVARLMGAGALLVRSDLEYERYRIARPRQVWRLMQAVPTGLGPAQSFGTPAPNLASPSLPMLDEIHLDTADVPDPAPVTVLPVTDPLPIVRMRAAAAPTILAGDGEGVVEAGATGLLDNDGVLLYSAALTSRPDVLSKALGSGARLVLTDTNRKRAMRWNTLRDNDGYTEQADEVPLQADPSDNRLPLFPGAGPDAQTTVEQQGVARVEASNYGFPVTYTTADRPALAFDGDPTTSWKVGTLRPVVGERILVQATGPVTTDHVDLTQVRLGPRVITKVGVVLDGRHLESVPVGDQSFAAGGQRIELGGARTFTTLELVIEGDNGIPAANANAVGISEIDVAGLRVDEVVNLPTDLLTAAGPASIGNDLSILLSRLRADPSEPTSSDEELTMARSFSLPTPRTFALSGQARLAAGLPDEQLDAMLGTHANGLVAARSSGRLQGALADRASATVDGDPATAWTNHFGDQAGSWLEYQFDGPRTLDHLDLSVVADGEHSVPTRVKVIADGGTERDLTLPAIADHTGVRTVHLPMTPLQGTTFRVVIDAVRPVTTIDWFSTSPIAMPVSVAEVGIDGAGPVTQPDQVPGTCRDDLLEVDGKAVWLQVTGSTPDATALDPLTVQGCGPDAGGIQLAAGRHELRSADGRAVGYDLDRLLLGSTAGGGPTTAAPTTAPVGPQPASGASVQVRSQGRTAFDLHITGKAGPVWLVLGQSWSLGWHATAGGHSLGRPVLVDGYANGWLVDPGPTGAIDVTLRWQPERIVLAGLGTSAVGVLVCLGLVLAALRRRRPVLARDDVPRWRRHPRRTGPATPWRVAVPVSLAVGAGLGILVQPWLGLAMAAVALLALRLPHGRVVPAVGAAAGIGLAGAYTAAKELRYGYKADFGWTDVFHPAHVLAWVGLLFAVLLIVVDGLRPDRPDDDGRDDEEPAGDDPDGAASLTGSEPEADAVR
jgi:arabinofuranan 3-O-arabinosyltransferase